MFNEKSWFANNIRKWLRGKRIETITRKKNTRHRLIAERLEDRTMPSVTLLGLPNWNELGPKPITNETGSDPNGPASGAIEEVVVDPGRRTS
jgi:hypothetical protein